MLRTLIRTLRLDDDLEAFAFYWRVAIRPHSREAWALLLLMVSGAALDAASVGLTVPLLDVLTDPSRAGRSRVVAVVHHAVQSLGIPPSTNMVIFTLMIVVSVCFVVRSLLLLLNQYWTAAVAVKLRWSTKTALFERFLNARYEALAKRARGTVVNDINVPAESLAGAITNLGFFFTGLFNSLLMIGLLLYLSWWATLLIGLFAVGGVQGWRWYADHRATAEGRKIYALRSEQTKLVVDAVDGLKVVKAHGLESRMVERQHALLASEYAPELRLVFFRNGPMLVNELIAIVIVLGLGAVTFFVPSLGIRVSMLAAFLVAIRKLAPTMANLNQASVSLSRYKRELEMIDEVTHKLPQEPKGGAPVAQVTELQLDQVVFAYASRPGQTILNGVSAAMRRGTVTAVVGPTGVGKSTISHLLLGLYEPVSGAVRINGVDLRRLDLGQWRRKIGYVSQDVFVFNTTIKENIALGDARVSTAQVEWAARLAQLREFIATLPDGYDTVVGDRGLRLSGGQCQRLAMARAILHKPEVLIFDEATSALDNLTERAVYDAISTLHHEAIVVVIAHRLSTVREADQILVLQGGQVVERGTHETLISQRGVYAALYEEDGRASVPSADAATVATPHV